MCTHKKFHHIYPPEKSETQAMIPSSRLLFRQISKQSISVNCYSVQTVKLPKQHEWNRAVASAEKMVGFPTSLLNLQSLMNDDVTGKASFITQRFFKFVWTKNLPYLLQKKLNEGEIE